MGINRSPSPSAMALISAENPFNCADASSIPRSTPSPGAGLARALPLATMRPTKVISSGFISSSRRFKPRPPAHCCVTNAIVVVPFALLSFIRSSNCKSAAQPKRSPVAGPASPLCPTGNHFRCSAMGSRRSTPAARTSSAVAAPMSTYISSG